MTSTFVAIPEFCHHQMVCFMAGKVIIKSFQLEAGNWIY